MDDVWGEVEEDTYESEHRDREWKRMNSMHAVNGFRAGIDAGRNVTSQSGFNAGFEDGSLFSSSIGKLLGVVSVVETFFSNHPELLDKKEREDKLEKLAKLKSDLESIDSSVPTNPSSPDTLLHTPPDLQPFIDRCKALCSELGISIPL